MIKVENLQKKFGSIKAVEVEKLEIPSGEILGIVGNNGAGKTTFLRMLLDLIKPDKGYISSKGEMVYQSSHWKKYTGSYIDENFLIEFLKPEEYFGFIGFLYGIKEEVLKAKIDEFRDFMNKELIGNGKYLRNLSSGNKQKVGIIGAMIAEPEVLILDEPFNFLDPSSQIIFKNLLLKYHESKTKTIVISSHNLTHISELCTRIVLMEKGKFIQDIRNEPGAMKDIENYFEDQIRVSKL
jgi:ABC-2 type transport system ATP-binding protein